MADIHAATGVSQTLTRNQALVLEALRGNDGPLSAYAILEVLRDKGLRAPPQIYRALDKLIALGLAHKLESLNAYMSCEHDHAHDDGEACSQRGPTHNAVFAICDACGCVRELCDSALTQRVQSLAKHEGFNLAGSTLELHGRCDGCSTQGLQA